MTEETIAYEQILRKGGNQAIRETSGYFEKRGPLFHALYQLVERLNIQEIPYAVLGALAMTQHGHARMTEDISLLLAPKGLEQFRQKLIELKLASGVTASHRLRDLADVQDLIARLKLPLSIADQLDPFVRETYLDL